MRIDYKTMAERVDAEFWIAPNGKTHKYKPTEDETDPFSVNSLHESIARSLFPSIPRPGDYMGKIGWIAFGVLGDLAPTCYKEPTQSQINTLFDLGYTHTKAQGFVHGSWQDVYVFRKVQRLK